MTEQARCELEDEIFGFLMECSEDSQDRALPPGVDPLLVSLMTQFLLDNKGLKAMVEDTRRFIKDAPASKETTMGERAEPEPELFPWQAALGPGSYFICVLFDDDCPLALGYNEAMDADADLFKACGILPPENIEHVVGVKVFEHGKPGPGVSVCHLADAHMPVTPAQWKALRAAGWPDTLHEAVEVMLQAA